MSVIFGWLVTLQTYGDLVRFWVFFFFLFLFLLVLHIIPRCSSLITGTAVCDQHTAKACRTRLQISDFAPHARLSYPYACILQ